MTITASRIAAISLVCVPTPDQNRAVEFYESLRNMQGRVYLHGSGEAYEHPELEEDWIHGMHGIVSSPDNKILAIEHAEQYSVWYIGPVLQP